MLLRARGTFSALAVHPATSPSNLPPDTPGPDGTNIWTMTYVAAIGPCRKRSVMLADLVH